MEKTTVLARLQFTIQFTEDAVSWMEKYSPNAWFVKDDGSPLLHEYGSKWKEIIETNVNHEVQGYFRELGVSSNELPYVSHAETYKGSWIFDAAIVMKGSAGNAYSILKQTKKDLPGIAEDLSGLKSKIQKQIEPSLSQSISETLYAAEKNSTNITYTVHNIIELVEKSSSQNIEANLERERKPGKSIQVPKPPSSLIATNFVIDARPLAALTPALLKTHKVHLSIGVSRDSFTLENLGDDILRDVRLGVFRTRTQRSQWSYEDSYMGGFPLVSSRQTVIKQVREFIDRVGNRLNFSDGEEVYVDCWVQDSHGIYIFQFFLEEE